MAFVLSPFCRREVPPIAWLLLTGLGCRPCAFSGVRGFWGMGRCCYVGQTGAGAALEWSGCWAELLAPKNLEKAGSLGQLPDGHFPDT